MQRTTTRTRRHKAKDASGRGNAWTTGSIDRLCHCGWCVSNLTIQPQKARARIQEEEADFLREPYDENGYTDADKDDWDPYDCYDGDDWWYPERREWIRAGYLMG